MGTWSNAFAEGSPVPQQPPPSGFAAPGGDESEGGRADDGDRPADADYGKGRGKGKGKGRGKGGEGRPSWTQGRGRGLGKGSPRPRRGRPPIEPIQNANDDLPDFASVKDLYGRYTGEEGKPAVADVPYQRETEAARRGAAPPKLKMKAASAWEDSLEWLPTASEAELAAYNQASGSADSPATAQAPAGWALGPSPRDRGPASGASSSQWGGAQSSE
jgi:hypothetical protein